MRQVNVPQSAAAAQRSRFIFWLLDQFRCRPVSIDTRLGRHRKPRQQQVLYNRDGSVKMIVLLLDKIFI